MRDLYRAITPKCKLNSKKQGCSFTGTTTDVLQCNQSEKQIQGGQLNCPFSSSWRFEMKLSERTERMMTAGLVALLVGIFIYQVAYGYTESYRYGYKIDVFHVLNNN